MPYIFDDTLVELYDPYGSRIASWRGPSIPCWLAAYLIDKYQNLNVPMPYVLQWLTHGDSNPIRMELYTGLLPAVISDVLYQHEYRGE